MTATVTASQKGMTRRVAAPMHRSDMTIQITPWLSPRMKVSGWGPPRAKAQTSSPR